MALAILVVGGLGARWIVAAAPAPDRAAQLPGPAPVPVETHLLEERDVERLLSTTGTLEAAGEAQLASELGGRVEFVAPGLRRGGLFQAGDVLLRVDTARLEAELAAQRTSVSLSRSRQAAAEEDLAGAQASLVSLEARRQLLLDDEARWRGLVERGRAEAARLDAARSLRLQADAAVSDARRGVAASQAAIEAAALELQLSENRVTVLETDVERATVTAPFTGRFVTAGAPTVGSTLTPLMPFGSLLDLSAMRMAVDVHEDDLAALHMGAAASAVPLSAPGVLFEGAVTSIGARVDPLTRSVPVEVLFPAAFAEIPSGTFVRAELRGRPLEGALWVPESWLTFRDGEAAAFVVSGADSEGGPVAELRKVQFEPGLIAGGRVIRSGLRAGDELVTTSLQLVGDGAPLLLLGTPR